MIFKKALSAKVAVLIRTKDRPHFLRRTLDDLAQQTMRDWCAAIINDGPDAASIHATLETYPENFRKKTTVLTLPQTIGRGTGLHLNLGIKHTDSDYITIHDDDDTWDTRFLEKTLQSIEGYSAVVTQSYLIKEEVLENALVEKSKEIYEPWQQHEISLFRLAESLTFPPIAMIFRRSILPIIGAFDDKLGPLEDWEFALRLFSEGPVFFLEEPLANYHKRINADEINSNTQEKLQKLYGKLDIAIRNKFLREDLRTGKMGLGFLLNISANQGRILRELLQEK
ncbi:MAG: glycosyltransferase family 2 protein [Oligoflexia bacterium]|nr:glycosyltransferase family 2 protein [Oligoflexia bacterium]